MQAKTLIKGIGIGILAGSVITAAIVPVDKRRIAHTKAGRAFRAVGQVVGNLYDVFT
ncbi:MAG: hypothetical protein LBR72_04915 [Oscillospiraceae bacterium]|jgi:predicted small secreted protein|nr:hypothetical protein [Oscillospiraceae bacterium]